MVILRRVPDMTCLQVRSICFFNHAWWFALYEYSSCPLLDYCSKQLMIHLPDDSLFYLFFSSDDGCFTINHVFFFFFYLSKEYIPIFLVLYQDESPFFQPCTLQHICKNVPQNHPQKYISLHGQQSSPRTNGRFTNILLTCSSLPPPSPALHFYCSHSLFHAMVKILCWHNSALTPRLLPSITVHFYALFSVTREWPCQCQGYFVLSLCKAFFTSSIILQHPLNNIAHSSIRQSSTQTFLVWTKDASVWNI